ncbi:hypothetical protein EVAR_16478_1 [Eumeta japonica]|uniref:Uncharacterized protein n=1 Tax=Eumeta variegata TaxID=151549 RepID=A0A4C1ULP6_EUMVA|nr:hypothetical protein EVAR_16478_1 [Eumeta japonica]
MGGTQERMVQSVKRALDVTLRERYPTEEVLTTLLPEMSTRSTAAHLHTCPCLQTNQNHSRQIISYWEAQDEHRHWAFSKSNEYGRKQWRQGQRLADAFWMWIRHWFPHPVEPEGIGVFTCPRRYLPAHAPTPEGAHRIREAVRS